MGKRIEPGCLCVVIAGVNAGKKCRALHVYTKINYPSTLWLVKPLEPVVVATNRNPKYPKGAVTSEPGVCRESRLIRIDDPDVRLDDSVPNETGVKDAKQSV